MRPSSRSSIASFAEKTSLDIFVLFGEPMDSRLCPPMRQCPIGRLRDMNDATSVSQFPHAGARDGRTPGRVRTAHRGRYDPGDLGAAHQGGAGRHRRLRRPHLDAGPHRQPRPCLPERGQHPLPRSGAADPHDGARGRTDAGDARPRLHHGARHRRGRLGHQGRRRSGPRAGSASVHRRTGYRPDRRTQRSASAHRLRRALPLLQRQAPQTITRSAPRGG